jgi:hypothetical protein
VHLKWVAALEEELFRQVREKIESKMERIGNDRT